MLRQEPPPRTRRQTLPARHGKQNCQTYFHNHCIITVSQTEILFTSNLHLTPSHRTTICGLMLSDRGCQ